MQTSCNEWVDMKIKSNTSNYATKLSFLILPEITGNVPAEPIDKKELEIPKHVKLADPHFNKPLQVEALIGAEVFYDLLMVGRITLSKPGISIQDTRLGWIVTGKLGGTWGQTKVKCHLTRNTVSDNLEKVWMLENAGEKLDSTKEEIASEQHFCGNTRRDALGRYEVRLPFNEKKQDLGFSYEAARRRFFILERKLDKNSKLKKGYQEFMKIYEELGHMEQTKSGPDEGYYMPHQAVIRESSLTSALRVVFDASQKTTTGISLNDSLMVGATIQDGVFELVLRFRCHTIVLTADIEKMYRQFWVHPQDRCYQKILWREDQSGPIKTYQLNTVTYGTSAAPFLATRCLKQLAIDEVSDSPKAAAVLESDFYVDDLMTGEETVEAATKLKNDLVTLTSKAGLKLCKWISNDPKVTEKLSDAEKTVQLKLDPEKKKRTLGICWNSIEDTFTYDVNIDPRDDLVTKRSILSQIAQLFDPLGLVAPVVLLAKITLQDLWKLSLDWDDAVPAEVERSWKSYQSQLSMINNWKINRAISSPQATNIQIHGFSDASMKAYGACLYLRVSTKEGCKTSLICAKSRVAPVKTVSLPRLELCGAVLLAKLYTSVRQALKLKIDATMFWTDSMIVLGWIRSSGQRKEIFVANRISEIQRLTDAENWAYVPTKMNTADFVSRGQFPAEFVNNEMWKGGPKWLNLSKSSWPNCEPEVQNVAEENSMITLTIKAKERSTIWNYYSSFTNLLRFVAYSLRFVNNARKLARLSGPLTTMELHRAWERIVKLVQHEEFEDEISSLTKNKEVSNKSKIKLLNPILKNNILRVGGRIKNSDENQDKIHPVLIPKKHTVPELIIRDQHARLMHAGANATLYAVRERYWIVDGKAEIRRILHSCVRCFRAKPKDVTYLMGNLPKVRVTAARPFENSGVDFCGPFFIKEKALRNRNKIKAYVAVFVCLSTRAVHLELVGDLTTASFLGCLRRFFARRGKAKVMYSDNGKNFMGANNELSELNNERVKQ